MPESKIPRLNVEDEDTVDVDVDTLVGDDELPLDDVLVFKLVPLNVLSHINVDISDIEHVLPVDHEHTLFALAR